MTYGFEDVVQIVKVRMDERSPTLRRMNDVLRFYDGEWALPYPELPDKPLKPNIAPALIASTVDSTARRSASVQPAIFCPATYPDKEKGIGSRDWARTRRMSLAATFHRCGWKLGYRRLYRQLAAYGTTAIVVRPGSKIRKEPDVMVTLENPLACYPEPRATEDITPVRNCAFVREMSVKSIRDRWPGSRAEEGGMLKSDEKGFTEMWQILEWWDDDQLMIGIMQPSWSQRDIRSWDQNNYATGFQFLAKADNRAGVCPAIIPQAVSLDRIASMVSAQLGSVELMNRLLTLDVIAQERAIFPDMYIVGTPNGTPEIVDGAWADGRTGRINRLREVSSVGEMRSTPDMRTGQTLDRLEGYVRESTSLSAMLTGQGGPNLRTGRAQDTLLGASIDPIVMELHEIVESFMPQVADAVFATYEGYWPGRKFHMYSGWQGAQGHVDFIPGKELADSHEVAFSYGIAGADVQGLTVALGQLKGLEAISQRSLMERHPFIDDVEGELEAMDREAMEKAVRESIVMGLVNDKMHPAFGALIEKARRKDPDIIQAVLDAYKEMQKQTAPGPEQGMPGAAQTAMPTPTPLGMPAAAPPGMPPPGMPPPDQALESSTGPSRGQMDMRQLLMALRAGAGASSAPAPAPAGIG